LGQKTEGLVGKRLVGLGSVRKEGGKVFSATAASSPARRARGAGGGDGVSLSFRIRRWERSFSKHLGDRRMGEG